MRIGSLLSSPVTPATRSRSASELRLPPRLEVAGLQGRVHLAGEVALGLEPPAQPHRPRCLLAAVEAPIAIREASLPLIEIDVAASEAGDVVEAPGVHDRTAREGPEARRTWGAPAAGRGGAR